MDLVETISRARQGAIVWQYELSSPKRWNLVLAYIEPAHDDRDIRCIEYSQTAPQILHRLKHGLRMGVYTNVTKRKDWIELRQARFKEQARPKWPTLQYASEKQLSRGAGFDLVARLRKIGASVGSKEKILKDNTIRRNYLCAAFPCSDHTVPFVAYTATRVLPLLRFRSA
jgi:hypothetical protein